MDLFNYIFELFGLYQKYLFVAFIGFIVAFLFTPLTGVIANRFNAIDKPARMRSHDDDTKWRRIHKVPIPNLGGIAISLGVLVAILSAYLFGYTDNTQILLVIGISTIIITIFGIIDSIKGISASQQLLVHFFLALFIVLGGIKIQGIDIIFLDLDFSMIEYVWNIGIFSIVLTPIADIITIFWIILLINAINWVSGIDALSGSMVSFASITMLFLAVRFDVAVAAILAAALLGGINGFLPFNWHPAKTLGGTSADHTMGMLIAILGIISGAKLTVSIIILALPIIDMAWVLVGRYLRHRNELKSPLDILKISDKTHLHHRLLDIGLSVPQTLIVEMIIFLVFCIIAYYFAGFRSEAIITLSAILGVLVVFTGIIFIGQYSKKRQEKQKQERSLESEQKKSEIKLETETPEEKYAY